MNEPRGWTFLCIWYENRGVGVYEVERLQFPPYMALCMPLLLRQRTSRVYQDHPHLFGVLTSFVPPVHNQGVSLAPLQGHALWKIFLLTTGSFFVLSLTDLSRMLPSPAPSGGRFPGSFPILSSFPVTAGFNPQSKFLKVQPGYDRALSVCVFSVSSLLCCLYLRPPDITHHFPRIIIHPLCQDCVEYPQNLTCHRYHGLHLL